MSKHLVLLPTLVLVSLAMFSQNSAYLDYIDKYKKIAIKEMERAGVPASIKLAQAILESNAGRSDLARRANNHFGIKCGADWTGKTYDKEDDEFDEFGNKVKSCFRKYKDDEDSYIAHSEFLRDPRKANRYGFLFRIDPMDYRRWALGLRTSGYATGAGYDTKLISIIETYELFKLDRFNPDKLPGGRPDKPSDLIAGLDVRFVNDIRVVFAKNRVTVQDISLLSGIPLKKLEKYNEQLPAPHDSLSDDYRVFLQPKRCTYREKKKWHYVGTNETMFDVSQLYGVKLDRLFSRNRLEEGEMPQKNERIKLKGTRVRLSERPRITAEKQPTSTVPILIREDEFLDVEVVPTTPSGTKPPATQPATGPANQPAKPPSGAQATKPPQNTGPAAQPGQNPTSGSSVYVVVKGDTLYSISKKHNTSVNELMRLNNLVSTVIFIGQELRVK